MLFTHGYYILKVLPTEHRLRMRTRSLDLTRTTKGDSVPSYSLMVCNKVPAKSHTHKLPPTTVLLNTGASVSLMPSWQAKALSVEVKPRTDIIIRGADGQPLVVEGVGEIWARNPLATYWKKVKVMVTRDGS